MKKMQRNELFNYLEVDPGIQKNFRGNYVVCASKNVEKRDNK